MYRKVPYLDLCFSTYLNDLFFILEEVDVCNYADDTGLHICDKDLPNLLNSLGHDTHITIEWFERNYMKLNKEKHSVIQCNVCWQFAYENNQAFIKGGI